MISVFQHLAFGAVATGRTGGASVNQLLKAELREALEKVAGGRVARGADKRGRLARRLAR